MLDDSLSKTLADGIRVANDGLTLHKNLSQVLCNTSTWDMIKAYTTNQVQLISMDVYRIKAGAMLENGLWTKFGPGYTIKLIVPLESTPLLSVVPRSHQFVHFAPGTVHYDPEVAESVQQVEELNADPGSGVVFHSNMLHKFLPHSHTQHFAVLEFAELKRMIKPFDELNCIG